MIETFIEQLVRTDHEWFHKINTLWTHPVLDKAMPIFTDLHKISWVYQIVLPIMLVFWVYKFRRHAVGAILTSALSVVIADGASYRLIKKYIQRERPPAVIADIRILTDQYAGFSFTSNHAANSFAVAVVLSFFIPRFKMLFFLIALAVAYSRVYVGVHFPLDVICGAIVGVLAGKLAIWISFSLLRVYRHLFTSSVADLPDPPPQFRRK